MFAQCWHMCGEIWKGIWRSNVWHSKASHVPRRKVAEAFLAHEVLEALSHQMSSGPVCDGHAMFGAVLLFEAGTSADERRVAVESCPANW